MLKNLSLALITAALGVAQAASYNVTLFQDSTVNGKQLKAGAYRLDLKDNAATLKRGKEITEITAHAETATQKFPSTMVRYDKNSEIREILIGGSKTKIVMDQASATAGGTQ